MVGSLQAARDMSHDILPDSRMRDPVGGIRAPGGGTLIPIYCANCGKQWGMVPEESITFAFALCDPCAETDIAIAAHFYKEPDAVFWERIENAQREGFGRPLNPQELATQLDDPTSTLAKLADEWRAHAVRAGR